jgi:hypothetical protein
MLTIPPEDQASLEHHLQQAASILNQYTEPDKLKDIESIEVELRNQMLTVISPTVAEIFFPQAQSPTKHRASSKASSGKSESATNEREN